MTKPATAIHTEPKAARATARGPGRLAAAVVRVAGDRRSAAAAVLGFAFVHAALWTVILTGLKAAQDVHMDVAEAFGWGREFLLGYGKHPPLSGWISAAWFTLFPVRDWSTYALAMATVAVALVICGAIARRVVDDRRAFMVVVLLAIDPVFNFKGFKFNPDLLQLSTLPLIVLAYLHAFERRTVLSGVLLGLAGAAGLLTKYSAVMMIGAVGLAALIHPGRRAFLRSPAPWTAILVCLLALSPHLVWLVRAGFAPFLYAGDVYERPVGWQTTMLALGYLGHNAVLLLASLAALALSQRWVVMARRHQGNVLAALRGVLVRPPSPPRMNLVQARNVWWIQAIVALVPPLAAAVLGFYMKSDWGIPLFFLAPLCLLAAPQLGLQRRIVPRLLVIWLVFSAGVLIAVPWLAPRVLANAAVGSTAKPASQLAQRLTELWQERFHSPWPIAAGFHEVNALMTFYSPDHPAAYTPDEPWQSGIVGADDLKLRGFIGICDTSDSRLAQCEAWLAASAPQGERLDITTRRFFRGEAGPPVTWRVVISPPGSAR